jgi:hypothetical protein
VELRGLWLRSARRAGRRGIDSGLLAMSHRTFNFDGYLVGIYEGGRCRQGRAEIEDSVVETSLMGGWIGR